MTMPFRLKNKIINNKKTFQTLMIEARAAGTAYGGKSLPTATKNKIVSTEIKNQLH